MIRFRSLLLYLTNASIYWADTELLFTVQSDVLLLFFCMIQYSAMLQSAVMIHFVYLVLLPRMIQYN